MSPMSSSSLALEFGPYRPQTQCKRGYFLEERTRFNQEGVLPQEHMDFWHLLCGTWWVVFHGLSYACSMIFVLWIDMLGVANIGLC